MFLVKVVPPMVTLVSVEVVIFPVVVVPGPISNAFELNIVVLF